MSAIGLVRAGRAAAQSSRCVSSPSLILVRNKVKVAIKKPTTGFRGNQKGSKKAGIKISRRANIGNGIFKPLPPSGLPPFEPLPSPPDVPLFEPELVTEDTVGKIAKLPTPPQGIIKRFGVPKKMIVEHRLLAHPYTVIRNATLDLVNTLDGASETSSAESRWVLTGSSGCGKSVLLLQAAQHAASKGWIVMYIPRAQSFVNSTTQYAYDVRTRTYHQDDASYQLLDRFLDVNGSLLDTLKTQEEFVTETSTTAAGNPLRDLIQIGLKDKMSAPSVLTALFNELALQKEYPVLLAVDEMQALYNMSLYRDPYFSFIYSYYLSVPRLLLEYISGQKQFARGAFLGATSTLSTHFQPTIELCESLGIQYPRPSGPYVQRKQAYVDYARGLRNIPVPEQLTVDEAAALFDIWTRHGVAVKARDDETFLAKYTEASGNARDFIWTGLLSSIAL